MAKITLTYSMNSYDKSVFHIGDDLIYGFSLKCQKGEKTLTTNTEPIWKPISYSNHNLLPSNSNKMNSQGNIGKKDDFSNRGGPIFLVFGSRAMRF